MEYPVFCVNLERRPDRKEFFSKQSQEVGLSKITFFRAVDGSDEKLLVNSKRELNLQISSELPNSEQGCLLSHALIWKKMIDDGIELALILEDDACFVKSFVQNLQQIVSELVKLNGPFIIFCGYIDASTVNLQGIDNVTIQRMTGSCPTHCYFITKTAAIIMLQKMQSQIISLALDQYIFTKYDSLRLLQSSMSICHQNYSYTSDIQSNDWTEAKLNHYLRNGFPKGLVSQGDKIEDSL